MLISAMFCEQPSNVFITVKSRGQIACISRTKHDLGLKTGAIVFYDLTLDYESLFRNFLGIELMIDFCPVVARKKWMILNDEDFHLENDVFY
jgi:hypothetical protein